MYSIGRLSPELEWEIESVDTSAAITSTEQHDNESSSKGNNTEKLASINHVYKVKHFVFVSV